jgi:hypothetical protein
VFSSDAQGRYKTARLPESMYVTQELIEKRRAQATAHTCSRPAHRQDPAGVPCSEQNRSSVRWARSLSRDRRSRPSGGICSLLHARHHPPAGARAERICRDPRDTHAEARPARQQVYSPEARTPHTGLLIPGCEKQGVVCPVLNDTNKAESTAGAL